MAGQYGCFVLSKKSAKLLKEYVDIEGFDGDIVDPDGYHCTFMYSRNKITDDVESYIEAQLAETKKYEVFETPDGNVLVMLLNFPAADDLFKKCISGGATYDHPSYKPHVTLVTNFKGSMPSATPIIELKFDSIKIEPLEE